MIKQKLSILVQAKCINCAILVGTRLAEVLYLAYIWKSIILKSFVYLQRSISCPQSAVELFIQSESVGFVNARASIWSISSWALERMECKGRIGLSKLYKISECQCSVNFTSSCLLLHHRHLLGGLAAEILSMPESLGRLHSSVVSMVLILPFF